MAYSTVIISRGILRWQDKLLLCRMKGTKFWFFPGGHVEDGEDAMAALIREMDEEAGVRLEDVHFASAVHNSFEEHGRMNHELNMVFTAEVAGDAAPVSREAHLEFGVSSMDDLAQVKVLPAVLKGMAEAVLRGEEIPSFIGHAAEFMRKSGS